MAQRVAVTGIGVVSAVGVGYEPFAEAVVQGITGLGPWSGSPDEPLLVGEVVGFQVRDYLVAEKGYLDRASEFALAATKLCLDQAGLSAAPGEAERCGIVLGTQYGCLGTAANYTQRVRSRGVKYATPLVFSHAFVNTPTSLISIDFGLKGYHATITSGAASGLVALETALVALAMGHADAVLTGAVDALCPDIVAGHAGPLLRTDDPDAYDPSGDNQVALGEGAAMLLLETEANATARGAEVLAWLSLSDGEADWYVSTDGAATSCAPQALYGDCLGAAGALAVAAAIAGLRGGVMPALRGGDEPLDDRREPLASEARTAGVGGLTVALP
ncbi:MAG: hypothetical protein HZB16_19795 [Armatimonadetes bacterium]|nr:hypothetical protein [Armatimonadota bacterium]